MPVAAQYISVKSVDGLTVYAVLRRYSDLDYWNTHSLAFEGFVAGHWYSSGSDNYAIVASKVVQASNVVADYQALLPSLPAGAYFAEWYIQQGANPAASDGPPAWRTDNLLWNGTTILPTVNLNGNEVVDVGTNGDKTGYSLAASQAFNNTGQTTPVTAYALPVVSGSAPASSTPALQDQKISLAVDYPWNQPFAVPFDMTGWTEMVWMAKAKPTDADTASIIAIKLRNPTAGGDGLIYLNGGSLPVGTSASDGTITGVSIVTGTSPSTSWVVNLTALGAAIPAGGYLWEVAFWISGVKSKFLGTGILTAQPSLIASSAPL